MSHSHNTIKSLGYLIDKCITLIILLQDTQTEDLERQITGKLMKRVIFTQHI